jgi:group I intron endonuclease
MTSGIYSITHTDTGRQYIGSTKNFSKRQSRHRQSLCTNTHANPHLQNAWNKYGQEAFEFKILEECKVDDLIQREQWYFDNYNPEFNVSMTAGSPLGIKRSEETKEKLKQSHEGKPSNRKGIPCTAEVKEKLRLANLGKSSSFKGKTHTKEAKEKISLIGKGRKAWNKGKKGYPHTPERKEKIRMASLGRTPWNKDKFTYATCHPTKRVEGKGLCHNCYNREWTLNKLKKLKELI